MKKKVLLGLSGGVDSAVAAIELKNAGYDVTCAFMRNWDALANNDILGNPTIGNDVCPQEADYMDALEVAKKLGLECLRVDFVKEYWDHVFVQFLDEDKKGRTPNPDILCNKDVKFDAFLKFAEKNGFDYVATGHYAQVRHDEEESVLLRGNDSNKDQTYFLCQMSKEALRKTLFPIGHLTKSEVREMAIDYDLVVAKKKDSTGICFIGERNFREFLKNYLPAKEGDIVDINSLEKVGRHQGVLYYTIGQRKGMGIGGDHGPYFVVGKDVEKNILYVSCENDSEWLYSDSCLVSGVNWFSKEKPNGELTCTAKFRYRQKDNDVKIRFIDDTTVFVTIDPVVSAVTPGQEAVFYMQDVCLGGGVIEDVFYKGKSLDTRIQEGINNDKKTRK